MAFPVVGRFLVLRSLAGALLLLSASQCRRPCVPDLEIYESPAESLLGLSEEFSTHGDVSAQRLTLERIVRRYPSSRFARMAKDALARLDAKQSAAKPNVGPEGKGPMP